MAKIIVAIVALLLVSLSPVAAQDAGLPELEVITAENASSVVQLARFGRGTVNSAAWSPDSQKLAFAGALGVWLYDANDLDAEPRLFEAAETPIANIAFNPDSALLAAAGVSSDDTVRLWDVETGEVRAVMHSTPQDDRGSDPIYAVAFSPDGRFLATGHFTGKIRLWNIDTTDGELGALISIFQSDEAEVFYVAFSSDSQSLFSRQNGEMRQWRVRDGALLNTVGPLIDELGDVIPNLMVLSPDGALIASGSSNPTRGSFEDGIIMSIELPGSPGILRVLDTQTGEERLSIAAHEANITALSFSPDRMVIATATDAGDIRLTDTQTGDELALLGSDGLRITDLVFSPEGDTLVSINSANKIILWDVDTSARILTLTDGFTHRFLGLAISPDNRLIAASDSNPYDIDYENFVDGAVRLWDTSTGEELPPVVRYSDFVIDVDFSPDGGLLVAADFYMIDMVEVATREEIFDSFGNPADIDLVTSIAFSPDGNILVSVSADTQARLWDVATGDVIQELEMSGVGTDVAFSPNGAYFAAVTQNGYTEIWEIASGLRTTLPPNGLNVYLGAVDFSSDSRVLLTAGLSGIRLWDVRIGALLFQIDGNFGAAAFSPDSSVIASDYPQGLALWDTCTGEQLTILSAPSRAGQRIIFPEGEANGQAAVSAQRVEFSDDGRLLASVGTDGIVRLWGVPGNGSATSSTGAACRITPTPIPSQTFTPSPTATATATFTPSPTATATPSPTPLPEACRDAQIPRLVGGEQGRVLDDDPSPINMRSGAGTGFERILEVPAGAVFMVLSGPICADGYFWYEIDYNGTIGWVAEGVESGYFTEPYQP